LSSEYFVVTKALFDVGIAATVGYADAIDHHLASSEMASRYLAASAQAFLADLHLAERNHHHGSPLGDHPLECFLTWFSDRVLFEETTHPNHSSNDCKENDQDVDAEDDQGEDA